MCVKVCNVDWYNAGHGQCFDCEQWHDEFVERRRQCEFGQSRNRNSRGLIAGGAEIGITDGGTNLTVTNMGVKSLTSAGGIVSLVNASSSALKGLTAGSNMT
jgi:hypothetical protein